MDLGIPPCDGIWATRQILSLHPQAVIVLVAPYPDATFRATAGLAGARGFVLKENLLDLRQWLRGLGVRVLERRTHVRTKSLISGLAMLALVFGAQRGVTAAGNSQKKTTGTGHPTRLRSSISERTWPAPGN